MAKRKYYSHEERKKIAIEEFNRAMIEGGQRVPWIRRHNVYVGLEFLDFYKKAGLTVYKRRRNGK